MRRIRGNFSSLVAAFLIVAATLVSGTGLAQAAVIRPFGTRFTVNTTGAIVMTGNALLTCPATAASCLGARTGTAPTLAANNNNNFNMIFVDIDGDPATFNSSRNTLSIPATSTVLWAGLYWGADTTAGTGGVAAANAGARNQVLFQTPVSGAYVPITAAQVDTSPVTGGVRYQGFADVTTLVSAARSGEYTTANMQAGRGTDRYGGWALVVALQDPNEPVRNLTVFDGYAVVQQTPASDQNVAIPVSGFLTPPTGAVRSRVGVVAYEGDLGLLGDSLRLNTTPLTNSLNPATNFFNSSLTGLNATNTTGDPFQTNMLGFDIDTISANGVLANGATSATINLNTNSDTYFPGVVSFSTELFAPRLELGKSAVDINGAPLDVGDEVLYTVRVSNVGDDGASNVILNDVIPQWTTYVPGSLRIDGQPATDAAGDDAGELAGSPARVITRLGTGATAAVGGNLGIGQSATMSFMVTVGTVPVDEVLTNTATVGYRGATSGLALEGVSNSVDLAPRPLSDLSLLKYGPTAPVTVPGPASFQLIVVNRGPATEPVAVVTDNLPAGFTADAVTPSQGSCAMGNPVVCNIGSLAVGASATIDISGTVGAGSGAIANTASASGDNLDQFPNNNRANAIVALNNPPSTPDQIASTPSATPVVIPVLTAATDPDGDALTTTSVGPAGGGTVVINPDGTVTYTPNANFKGVDLFTYTVSDGRGGYATASVTVTVSNAPPVAVDDQVATPLETAINIAVLTNDSDANGDALAITAVTDPANGSVLGNADGTITYLPNNIFKGVDSFTYTISDGEDTATATVTVVVPDAAPVATDDFVNTPSATPITIAVLANDLDNNGDPLAVSGLGAPSNGLAVNNGDGTVTYTPNVGFKGVDSFTYEITDLTSPATATVYITVSNAAPTAVDDAINTAPSTAVNIAVLANDLDENADVLSVIGTSAPGNGSAVVNADGTIDYVPNDGFKGIDTFTYTVSDGTDTALATVSVTVPNSPPAAAADRRTTEADTPVSIDVIANDFDPNSDALSVFGVSAPTNGTAVANADGTVTYSPNAGFKGVDSFTYTVSDGSDTATATVTVTVLNAPPVAVDDSATTAAGAPVIIDLLSNDGDANGDSLSVVALSPPANGVVAINPDGTVTYTPNAGFTGVDSFTYTVSDGPDTATATALVSVANTIPVAVDDSATAMPNTPVIVPVLANDSDADGDVISVTTVSAPSNGVAVDNGDGTVTYTPTAGFKGVDTFTYTVSDGADSAAASVLVTVPNMPPVAVDDYGDTTVATPLTLSPLANDSDANSDALSVTDISSPANGTAIVNLDWTVTYTPNLGFIGTDTFSYTVSDGTDTATALVTISVTASGTVPSATDDFAVTPWETPTTIAVLANDSDLDGDTLSVSSASQPARGSVVVNSDGTITYSPDSGFSGIDTFTYTISDGANTATATVEVTVLATATIPQPLAFTGGESGRLVGAALALFFVGWILVAASSRREAERIGT